MAHRRSKSRGRSFPCRSWTDRVARQTFTDVLALLLRLPSPLLQATGWFLLAYAAAVGWIALRTPIPRGLVWPLVVGNAIWAVACVGLLASGVVAPSALGVAWVLAQAFVVAGLAELQWTALRRPVANASWA